MAVNKEIEIFSEMPVTQAVLRMSLTTVASQVITVIYNVADALFLGQLGVPAMVAATSLCMPPLFIMNVLGCLFGIGGAGAIARNIGSGNRKKAKQSAAFCTLSTIVLSIAFGIILHFAKWSLMPMIGADAKTLNFCCEYIFWTITLGAMPATLSVILSHLVRAEGHPRLASAGIMGGGILNFILDPIFIFALGMELKGAAIATLISNIASLIYYFLIIFRNREHTYISFSPKNYAIGGGVASLVVVIGLPSCIMTVMTIASNTVLNKVIASYSTEAIAGMTIAKKINTLAYAVAHGMTQGVLPLIAYNYSSGNRKRMKELQKAGLIIGLVSAVICMAVLYFCAEPVSRIFIDEAETVAFGTAFLKVICLSCPLVILTMMMIMAFQAVGDKKRPMLLSLLSKGTIDVAFVLILNKYIGLSGVAWATPLADSIALIVTALVFFSFWKKQTNEWKR